MIKKIACFFTDHLYIKVSEEPDKLFRDVGYKNATIIILKCDRCGAMFEKRSVHRQDLRKMKKHEYLQA